MEKILWSKCRQLEGNIEYFVAEIERLEAELAQANDRIIELATEKDKHK